MKVKIIAEIGCNHRGEMDTAKAMIISAWQAGADYVKFQKRCNKELLTEEEYNTPHPNAENSYGETYGEHREFLEFNLNQHRILKTLCGSLGVGYSCSVWDVTSAMEIISLGPENIKIPSALNYNIELYETLFSHYKQGKIHVSLGMTNLQEERQIITYFTQQKQLHRLVLYHCTSAYPAPFNMLYLKTILRLKKDYPAVTIAYSGHHTGIAADIAAITYGAEWIERHYTHNKKWKGTDHSASLETPELEQLVGDVREVEKTLKYKNGILQIEQMQRDKLKKISAGVNGELV